MYYICQQMINTKHHILLSYEETNIEHIIGSMGRSFSSLKNNEQTDWDPILVNFIVLRVKALQAYNEQTDGDQILIGVKALQAYIEQTGIQFW